MQALTVRQLLTLLRHIDLDAVLCPSCYHVMRQTSAGYYQCPNDDCFDGNYYSAPEM